MTRLSPFLAIAILACAAPPGAAKDSGFPTDPAHDPCTQPGDEGNELHVGQYCTTGSGVCENNLGDNVQAAFICTLDHDSAADLAMCTKPCTWNGNCGSDAICRGDKNDAGEMVGPKGCVPTACTDDPGVPNPPDAG